MPWGLVWLVIAILRATGVIKGGPAKPVRPGFWVVVVRLFVFCLLFGILEHGYEPTRTIVLVSVAALCAPGPLIHFVLVPLGLWRAAYWATMTLRPLGVGADPNSTAACHAARALARHRAVTREQIAWIEERLEKAKKGRGALLVASGLLSALRGDRRAARRALATADELNTRFLSYLFRCVARDWLVADAAASGNWDEVIRYGVRRAQTLRWSYAVGRMAERLVKSADATYDFNLVLLWALAPRRRSTWPLLVRAIRTPRRQPARPRHAGPPPSLPEALSRLAALLRGPEAPTTRTLEDIARALESTLLLPAARAQIERRTLGLDVNRSPDQVLADFSSQLETVLAGLLAQGEGVFLTDDAPPLLAAAASGARRKLVREIEVQCKDYAHRTEHKTALTELDEWRAWAGLLDSGERLLFVDASASPMLFELAYVSVCNFAVFQHNVHKRTALAHQMYAWLHSQAAEHGSAAASLLLAKNMAAALD